MEILQKPNSAKVISCYAADTSGVCSMLYELGGLVCVHDASGCNSTYTTHDEARWTLIKSRIFISAMTEMDAVMGNDQKLVKDIVRAASSGEKPKFITLCGSPMAAMTGIDMDNAAEQVQSQTGITSFAVNTNGIDSYLSGAAAALKMLIERFADESLKKDEKKVNILGATPLDFSINGSIEYIKLWLEQNGFEVNCCMAMGSSLEEISGCTQGGVNLVISQSAVPAAKYLKERFSIPFVCGVPIGEKFSKVLAEKLRSCAKTGEDGYAFKDIRNESQDGIIIGEGIFSSSLAAAVCLEKGKNFSIVCPLECEEGILDKGDKKIFHEQEIEEFVKFNKGDCVIADPLYKPICGGKKFFGLPHEAFSGRCFRNKIPNIKKITDIMEEKQ